MKNRHMKNVTAMWNTCKLLQQWHATSEIRFWLENFPFLFLLRNKAKQIFAHAIFSSKQVIYLYLGILQCKKGIYDSRRNLHFSQVSNVKRTKKFFAQISLLYCLRNYSLNFPRELKGFFSTKMKTEKLVIVAFKMQWSYKICMMSKSDDMLDILNSRCKIDWNFFERINLLTEDVDEKKSYIELNRIEYLNFECSSATAKLCRLSNAYQLVGKRFWSTLILWLISELFKVYMVQFSFATRYIRFSVLMNINVEYF